MQGNQSIFLFFTVELMEGTVTTVFAADIIVLPRHFLP
jgi:hypothetical protein